MRSVVNVSQKSALSKTKKKSVKSVVNACLETALSKIKKNSVNHGVYAGQKSALLKIKNTKMQNIKINNIIRANIEVCEYEKIRKHIILYLIFRTSIFSYFSKHLHIFLFKYLQIS